MNRFECTLKYAPSLNSYYKHFRGRVTISQDGRDYTQHVKEVFEAAGVNFGDSKVRVTVDVYPPDRRRRDLDNLAKCLLDSVTKCSGWSDDSNINQLIFNRREMYKPGGKIELTIEEM